MLGNSLEKNEHHRSFDDLVNLLGLTLAGSHPSPYLENIKFINNSFKYEEFIKYLLKAGDDVSFVSLNYDIILDSILLALVEMDKIVSDYTYSYAHLINLESGEECRATGVKLLKPHGSLNLSFCPQCSQIYYFRDNIFTPIVHKRNMATCRSCSDGDEKIPVKPLIIPPFYSKGEFINSGERVVDSNVIGVYTKRGKVKNSAIYKRYRNAIDVSIVSLFKNADEIIIIGYSLPPYDYDFRTLMLQGLILNKKRKSVPIKIITIKDDKDCQHERYRHLAGDIDIIGEEGFYSYLQRFLSKINSEE